MSTVHLRPATEADVADIVDVSVAAFDPRTDVITRRLFPALALAQDPSPSSGADSNGGDADLRRWSVVRKSARMRSKRSLVTVAVDEADGAIVGYAMWFTPKDAADGEELPRPNASAAFDGLDRAALVELRGILEDDARETFGPQGTDDVWDLDSLGVHPRHQRRGIGRLLLDAGTRAAAVQGRNCYLIATPAGVPLYRAAGFESLRTVDVFGCPYVSMMRRSG